MRYENDDGSVVLQITGDKLIVSSSDGETFETGFSGDLLGSMGRLILQMQNQIKSLEASVRTAPAAGSAIAPDVSQKPEASRDSQAMANKDEPFGTERAQAEPVVQAVVEENFKALTYGACVFESKPSREDIEAVRTELFELIELSSEPSAAKVKALFAGEPFVNKNSAFFKAEISAVNQDAYSSWVDEIVDSFSSIPSLPDMQVKFAFAGPREVVMSAVEHFHKSGAPSMNAPRG